MSASPSQAGGRLGNYRIIQTEHLADLNLNATILRHDPTGARLLHLDCDDPNNVFAIGFRTPPPDSTGVAHILEHTVLCGSQKFPVRDPFFAMLKRSLNTFMNAMTASDWTFYPVASMTPKDLDNLMQIYLDAVFFPLLREMDFRQEGHRLEFAQADDPNSPLMIKGVVFNEMKGAMADPSSLLGRRLNRALFPTTCYGMNSGGEPLDIPKLTWEQLRAFHRRYYHPSNSWIFLYGDQPLAERLQRIEDLALTRFSREPVNSIVPLETRRKGPVRVEETFPIGPDDDAANRSIVQLAWLTCPIEDTFERAATNILANLLLGNPAAPLYQALIESKLGQNLSPGTGYHDDYRDTYLAAGLQGTDPEHCETIEALVRSTLERVAVEGFPAERVDAALHQYEFSNREVTGDQYPYGLSLLMRLLGPWLHAEDPLTALRIGQNLTQLREATRDPAFFPRLIRSRLLDNPHRVTLLMRPDADHSRREEAAIAGYLAAFEQQLDETARQRLVDDAAVLKTYQETPDDFECLPTLELSDINRTEPVPEFTIDDNVYRFQQPTNGITFLTLQFDLTGLPEDLRPHVPLFCALLPQIGAAGYDYLAMTRRITAATGGIRLGTNLLEAPEDLGRMQPVIDLKAKALDRNQQHLVEILSDMLTAPDFSDLQRLRTVIGQVKTAMENSIPGAGHSFASRAAAATLTVTASLREEWAGMSQVKQIRAASNLSETELAARAEDFKQIARFALQSGRVAAAVTAEADAQERMTPRLEALLANLPTHPTSATLDKQVFRAHPEAVGWSYTLPVAYVAQVFRTTPYTHPDTAHLQVLAKLLRANFLHREIREKGGAYGGMAGYSTDGGLLSLLSYRDPNLVRTLDVYHQAVDWACRGDFNHEMIKEAVLAVFGELDRPLSPGGRGYHEFIQRRQGLLPEMRQELRDRVLSTDKQALARVAETYLRQGWEQSAVGILAGDEMFEQAQDRLGRLGLQLNRL